MAARLVRPEDKEEMTMVRLSNEPAALLAGFAFLRA
jgi:hypothetical protein